MIKEAYCSFEVAKLLKEKGFKEECEYFYDWYKESESYHICSNGGTCNNERYPDEYSMPTHQMAMAWLREVHNVVIVIDVCRETGREGFYCWQLEDNHTGDNIVNIVGECPTYEKAVEAALKYVLENLI